MSTNVTLVIDGKLGRDAEYATRKDGTVVEPKFAKFSIPFSPYAKRNDDGSYPKTDTYWLEITASGNMADTAVKYYKKGTHVSVVCSLSSIMPQIKDGQLVRDANTQNPKVNVNLRASTINFVGNRADGAGTGTVTAGGDTAGSTEGAVEEEAAPF